MKQEQKKTDERKRPDTVLGKKVVVPTAKEWFTSPRSAAVRRFEAAEMRRIFGI